MDTSPPLMERLRSLSGQHSREAVQKIVALLSDAGAPDLSQQVHGDLETAVSHLGSLGQWLVSALQPHEQLRHLGQAVNQIGLAEASQMINGWCKLLITSLALPIENTPRILCAFTAVQDQVRYLDQSELDHFLDWAATKCQASREKLISDANKLRSVPRNCSELVDVVATLMHVFRNPGSGLKPYLETDSVRQQMWSYFEQESTRSIVGGAAAIQAETLSQLLPVVEACFFYHPANTFANAVNIPNVRRACVQDNVWRMDLSLDQIEPEHPKRLSCIFAISNSDGKIPYLVLPDGTSVHAGGSDRLIYGVRRYSGARHWQHVDLRRDHNSLISDVVSPKLKPHEWPAIPLFGGCSQSEDGQTLHFDIAGEAVLQQIATHYDCILIDGLKALADEGFTREAREHLCGELQVQLKTLLTLSPGLRIHAELSGASTAEVMDALAQVIDAGIRSIGVNPEELREVTALWNSRFFVWPKPSRPETLFERYWRGKHLLAQLHGLERLYIHGNEIDIELCRRIDKVDLEHEVKALLLAKAVVVLQILERSGVCYADIKKDLTAVLAEKGHLALIEFACDFADYEAQTNQDVGFELIYKSLVTRGYWRRSDGSAVIAVPVMWPSVAALANPAGAGDITSGVAAVFSRR